MWFIARNKKTNFSLILFPCLAFCFMVGCKEEAPPAKPTVVTKRIEQTPQTPAPEKKNAAPAPLHKTTQPPAAAMAPTTSPETTPGPAIKPEPSTTQKTQAEQASVQSVSTGPTSLKSSLPDTSPRYNPEGKIDPFAALFSEESSTGSSENREPKRPLTPLEKIDISQLQLVAILHAPNGNSAMVEDATGKGYILKPGTFIGINSGKVTKILEDRVVVEENTKDFFGKVRSNTRELKLQKPFGEE